MANKRSRTQALGAGDPGDGPSREWGWHGHFPRGSRLAGLGATLMLIFFLLTTRDFEQGATAVPWLAGIALVIVVSIAASTFRRRR
jgi:hypothetical protein